MARGSDCTLCQSVNDLCVAEGLIPSAFFDNGHEVVLCFDDMPTSGRMSRALRLRRPSLVFGLSLWQKHPNGRGFYARFNIARARSCPFQFHSHAQA